jgi:hypothetical protein
VGGAGCSQCWLANSNDHSNAEHAGRLWAVPQCVHAVVCRVYVTVGRPPGVSAPWVVL